MIINNNELKFAEKVILIDATYINKVTKDLSQHFSQVIGRELPKADLSIFLECVAMDAATNRVKTCCKYCLSMTRNMPRWMLSILAT